MTGTPRQAPAPITRGRGLHVCAVATSPKSIPFSTVLLLFKGIVAFQTFRGARNEWFWLLNRKLKALSVPLSWLEGLGLELFALRDRSKVLCSLKKQKTFPGGLQTSLGWYTTWKRAALLPGSNDSKQMCLTVCLASPGLKFCLFHSNCFLNFLSVTPPLVPPLL